MDISNKYAFYVGTFQGVLEYTSCKPKEKIRYTVPGQVSEITALEWGRAEDEILVGYKSGQVSLYNTIQDKYVKSISKLEGEGAITGLGNFGKSVLVANVEGLVNIWNGKKMDFFSTNLETDSTLDCMVHHKSRQNVVGTGGVANDFRLWDIETHSPIFKAKSMGHDRLQLPIPTSIRGITFFPEDDHLSGCATKEGHVLLYDDRAQRRPVVKYLEKKASFTCLASASRERQCLAGTTRGYMQLLDMKMPGRSLRTFTTFMGSVTSIVCDPVEPLVASTSMDRFLRVHHLDTKELVYKAYMKQSLTKILMKPIVKEEVADSAQGLEEVDEEYEEIFNKMEVVSDMPSMKTKRKSQSDGSAKKKKKKLDKV